MNVVKACKSDIPATLEIWKAFMDYHVQFDEIFIRSDDGEKSMGQYMERLIDADDALLLLAVENHKPLGYAIAKIGTYPPVFEKKTYGSISDLAVCKEHRRKGAGESLLNEMMDWFRFKGVDRVELRVASKNTVGYSFWQKHGFVDYVHEMYKVI